MQQAYSPQRYIPGTPILKKQQMPPQFHPPPGPQGQTVMSMSPRNLQMSLQPGTPTQSPAHPHQTLHSSDGSISTFVSPPSMFAPQNNSSLLNTSSANRLNMYANTFVPGPPRSVKITLRRLDGTEIDLKAISSKRANERLPLNSPSASGFNRTAKGHRSRKSQIIRIESEEAKADQERAVSAGGGGS